jgi:acyl-CoA thioesterase II
MSASPLADLFTLTSTNDGTFQSPPPAPNGAGHVFGGYVVGQALAAAAATVADGRPPHSLHAYFVDAGEGGVPVDLTVETVRDGRSFSLRRVAASQGGTTILVLDASFHVDEPGRAWPEPSPPSPSAQDCLGNTTYLTSLSWLEPFELRPVHTDARPAHPFWIRTRVPVPDDQLLQACLLVSIADIGVAGTAVGPLPFEGRTGPSLDHCVWLHRRVSPDRWLYFSAAAHANAGSRGLATGTLVTEAGELVATISQEVLLRERP